MRRTAMVLACVGTMALGGITAGPALASTAQVVPAASCGSDYPPTGPAVEGHLVVTGGLLTPGATTGTVVLGGASPGATYSGTLFSTAVPLSETAASGSGSVAFTNLAVPSGFALRAVHHIDVFRSCQLVGAFDVCVTSTGHLTSTASCSGAGGTKATNATAAANKASGSLPHTGWDHLFEVLRLAAIALCVGAFLLYLRRRRAAAVTRA